MYLRLSLPAIYSSGCVDTFCIHTFSQRSPHCFTRCVPYTGNGCYDALIPYSDPSPTALIDALFAAVTSSLDAPLVSGITSTHDTIIAIIRRFTEACAYTATLVHAGVSGPLAGPRALQMAIRKSSVWCPTSAPANGASAMNDEMERIAADRQRRKDHIQWAQIHGAVLELGLATTTPARASRCRT